MLSGSPAIFDLDPYTESSVQMHQVGARGIDKWGDSYRYAQIGASAVVCGFIMTQPAAKPNHSNCAANASYAANTTNKIRVTLGATAVVANEYADGYFVAVDNGLQGEQYRIISHPAADSAATLVVTLDRRVKSAIVLTTDEFALVHNTWRKSIVAAVSIARAAGVPVYDTTASYYSWLKTRGIQSVLIGSAATLGADLIAAATGAVTDRTDVLGASAEPVVAVCDALVGVATEYSAVRLVID